MKIGDIAKQAGLSVHTLRYYERIGLLPYALRDSAGQRCYDSNILSWLAFLQRLKTTGMPIRDMLHYANLRNGGEATLCERRHLLLEHRRRVQAHILELQFSLQVLDTKIAGYTDTNAHKETL